jgi:hypothetical protein
MSLAGRYERQIIGGAAEADTGMADRAVMATAAGETPGKIAARRLAAWRFSSTACDERCEAAAVATGRISSGI